MKVLIVGAGPTGLTAALEFVRKGIIPEVVDAKKCPSELSRAVGILPESIEKLKAFGVGDKILEEGVKFKKIKIQHNNKILIDLDVSKILEPQNRLVGLPQDRIETIMSDALRENGVMVKYDHRVVDIETNQEEATVTFSDGESKKYDWVIGSDGVNSTVREKLGIEYPGHELQEVWSIADVELEEEYNPESFILWLVEGTQKDVVVMVPIGPKRMRIVSSTTDSIQTLPVKLDIKNIKRAGTFKISVRQAQTYAKGRVLLAGDSAHTHSPVGGRGMNLGIDDAVEAVKAILGGRTHEYSNERRKTGARIIRGTERMRKILVSKNPFVKVSIRIVFFLIQHVYPFRMIFVRSGTRL